MASAAIGGLGPGLLATLLATLLDLYFFMMPYGTWHLRSADQSVRLGLFMIEGVLVSFITARLKAAKQHVEESAAEARELERRILEISEDEQRRIGHDLHDGLGQHLTGIALMTRRLQQRLSVASSPDAQDAAKLSDLAKTAVEWTHDLCRSLSPCVLETGGLSEAFRELAAYAESLFKIDCDFQQTGNPAPLDPASAVHLYRIAQEAISNAVRHGKAQHVELALHHSSSVTEVQIIDDGSGIHSTAPSANSMGLRIMQYRAKMIGATVLISRRPAGGTVVVCRYPIRGPSAAHGNN